MASSHSHGDPISLRRFEGFAKTAWIKRRDTVRGRSGELNAFGRYDRYVLAQLTVFFGFFSLVLIAVYWVNEAVDLFDALIADGQTLLIFLEFSVLTLPQIILLVLPVSAFVATLYAFNRMIGESELVVLQTAGASALRLLRPVLGFGLILGIIVAILGHVLVPMARSQYNDRSQDVQADVTGRLLRAGQFVHPTSGITVYISHITEDGEFRDLFLQDGSDPQTEITYIASYAVLLPLETGPRIVMFSGSAQTFEPATGRLSVVRFEDFTLDLGALIEEQRARSPDIEELSTRTLLMANGAVADRMGLSVAQMRFTGHDRIARSFFVIFPPLIAATALMLGHFSRFGVWPRILLAVACMIPVQMIWNVAENTAFQNADLYPMAYLQPAVAALATFILGLLAMIGPAKLSWRRKTV